MSRAPASVERKTIKATDQLATRPHEWLDTTWPGFPHLEQCMFCAIPRIPETENTNCPKRPHKKENGFG